MNIAALHQHFLQCTSISTDTRKIGKDSMFFALKGDHFDGNSFAQQALASGAKYCVIDNPEYLQGEQTLLVTDVLETLQLLATFHRQFLHVPIIALTGSNGKTTTKELINVVLSQRYKTTATVGNLNNHIGVPLTLLSMDQTTEMGIVEMGANHPGEIRHLCQIAQPDYGLITNFGKAHLEGFGSVEGVIKAKSELYDYLRAHGKVIFVNGNDAQQISQTASYAHNYVFGTGDNADLHLKLLETQPYVKLSYKNHPLQSHLTGTYNFANIAVAMAVGSYFKVEEDLIIQAIQKYRPTNNRSQIIEQNGNTVIMDAYNANPSSMLAALENLKQLEHDQKILILGDMFELGATAKEEHQAIVEYIERYDLGEALLVGDNFFHTSSSHPQVRRFQSFSDLKFHLEEHPRTGALILIKGSRGMALERVLPLL